MKKRAFFNGIGRALGVMLLGAVAVGSMDCAEERAPIDRTRPAAVEKSFFVGADLVDARDNPEFYINNFVVDAPASQSLMPVGTYDDVDRIRWEIQENVLLGRKAYEYVTGRDGRGVRGRTETGLIVAAYRIESHFDIRYEYNPTTGEQINVLSENTTDRPWWQRDHMRVDWSQNLVDNPDWSFLFYGTVFGDLSFQPVRYYEQNPRSPNAPNFCEMQPGRARNANGECVAADPARQPGGYFDVTSKWLVSPEMNSSFGFSIPTCLLVNFFTGSDTYDCNPQETTIRTSFRRVVDRDFEPLELTESPYDLVGGPRATRNGFDPGYGATDQNFHRYAMIHNIWERSHVSPVVECNSNADGNNDGTADECATTSARLPGSQCDMVMRKCTLPYRERTVRPVAYYTNPEMPAEFQDHVASPVDPATGNVTYRLPTASDPPTAVTHGATEQIMDSWNIAVMNAVAHAREVECRRTMGGSRDECHSQFFEAGTVPQADGAWLGSNPKALNGPAVVLCHNPVRQGDSPACREVGYSVRLGDIRYNHVSYWPGDSRARFGGIAHWGYDPLTGEIVSNGGFNMGRSVEYAAAQQRDYIRLILHSIDPALDPLTVEEYMEGSPSAVLAEIIRNPAARSNLPTTPEEMETRIRALDASHAAQSSGLRVPNFEADVAAATNYLTRVEYAAQNTPPGAATQTSTAIAAAARRLRGSPEEAALVTPEWLGALGMNPSVQVDDDVLQQASPLRMMDPEWASNVREQIMRRAESRGFCFQDMGAPPMIGSMDLQGVARWFLQKYRDLSPLARARRIYQDLRIDAYKGIALHEVGHSMGLYHVPVSSYDSMNYNPQYWQLRTNMGRAEGSCMPRTCSQTNLAACNVPARTNPATDSCMGPRYIDPETNEELGITESTSPHAGVNYFANTSTMEYQWERFGETVGMGAYDEYAMGILYGRVLETMESDTARGGMAPDDQANFAPRLTSQLAEQDRIRWRDPLLSPTSPQQLPVHYTELGRQLRMFDPSRCRDATAEERERYRWRIVDGKLCSLPPRDVASLNDFESGPTSFSFGRNVHRWRTTENARTGGGQVRWGYRVAWDIGTGYPHINYFDQGADIYEVAQSIVRRYDLTYPASYFRRGQREWLSWGISQGIASRLFRVIRGYHWTVASNVARFSSVFNRTTYDTVAHDDNYLRGYLMAGTTIFDFFASALVRPEVGNFFQSADRSTPELRTNSRAIFDENEFETDMPMFRIGVIDGRYIGTEYDNSRGGSWDYHHWPVRTGSYPEKPFAAIALTDTRPTFSSVTRDLFLDGREFQLNFRTDLPDAFNRLLGGLLSEDWATVAMNVDGRRARAQMGQDRVPRMPTLWSPPGTPVRRLGEDGAALTSANDAMLVYPNFGYRQQLPTVIFSMLFSSLNTHLDTVHRLRIFTEGGVERVDIPESERVRFTNPESGITYVSRRYGPDPGYTAELVGTRVIDRGIGSRMMEHANALASEAYQTDGANADGTPRFRRDAAGNLVPRSMNLNDQTNAVTRFRDYVGLVEACRNVARYLGYGVINY